MERVNNRLQARLRQIEAETAAGKQVLVFELNAGQMLEDVRLATRESVPIAFFGKTGGVVPLPEDVAEEVKMLATTCYNRATRVLSSLRS